MPVPNTIADLSQAAASNYPLGTDTVGPNLDDYIRAGFSFVRQLFDGTPWGISSIGGTGDAITGTTSAPFTAYVQWQTFKFVPGTNNATNSVTININGIGAKNITKNGTQPLAPGDLVAGVVAMIIYDGTQFQLLNSPATQLKSSSYSVRGLVGANNATTPNTKFDLAADAVTLKSVNGTPSRTAFGTGAITNDVGLAGPAANGRDQAGAFSASSWIHFYFIWNGTTLATLSSAVAPATGPTMPTGYTHWAYIGAVYFNGSSQLASGRMKGAWFEYLGRQSVLSAGSATTETAISLTAVVPPNAGRIEFTHRSQYADTSVTVCGVDFRLVSGTTFKEFPITAAVSGIGFYSANEFIAPNIGQSLIYIWAPAIGTVRSATVYVNGYSMPNGGE
jgi:hypothetical protein